MEIYKEHLIEALETEPLGWGNWCELSDYYIEGAIADITDCTVCAVGSVFRKFTRLSNGELHDVVESSSVGNAMPIHNGTDWVTDDLALPKNWLTAVSFVWESLTLLNEDIKIPEARAIMIDWVTADVPEGVVLWEV